MQLPVAAAGRFAYPFMRAASSCARALRHQAIPAARRRGAMSAAATMRGFTLLELALALSLLALIAAVLYGALSLGAESVERGEAKAQDTAQARLAQDFLRRLLSAQHPFRLRNGSPDKPLVFAGDSDTVMFVGTLPGRWDNGLYAFRVALEREDKDQRLVLSRVMIDYAAPGPPDFARAETSTLAEHVASLRLRYFGVEGEVDDGSEATWRDRWRDVAHLPELIQVEVTTSAGARWPALIAELRLASSLNCAEYERAHNLCK